MQVVELERENLRLNGVAGKACILDWRDRDSAMQLGDFKLILCADVLYASNLVKVLQLASSPFPERCWWVAHVPVAPSLCQPAEQHQFADSSTEWRSTLDTSCCMVLNAQGVELCANSNEPSASLQRAFSL